MNGETASRLKREAEVAGKPLALYLAELDTENPRVSAGDRVFSMTPQQFAGLSFDQIAEAEALYPGITDAMLRGQSLAEAASSFEGRVAAGRVEDLAAKFDAQTDASAIAEGDAKKYGGQS
jgi:hypothetical protein